MSDSQSPALSRRHRLFAAGFRAIAASRADLWLGPLARGCGVILTFHHVRPERPGPYAPNSLLAITPDFLDRGLALIRRRGFEIIGLDAVPGRLASGGRPFVALTFDDGYRDNVVHAAPVLRRHGAPWTLFVTSEFAEGRGRLWWLELERAIGRLDRVRIGGEIEGEVRAIDLPARDAAEKSRAFARVYDVLRAGPEAGLRATIADLCAEAGLTPGTLAGELCLTWSELRELGRDPDVTFGAHTISHPMLAKHDDATARREITQGRARIAAELGRPVMHLSYPVGDPTSAGEREFGIARDAGFATAVTTRPGHLFPIHARHRHALPRVSVNGHHQTEAALSALLSGVPFLAWNRGRRLNVA